MTARYVAVVEFGSSKITAIIGARGVNGTFNIRGWGECEYEGYASDVVGAGGIRTGEFYDPAYVKTAVKHALETAQDNAHLVADMLYVGVPAAFCTTSVKNVSVSLDKKRRINADDVNGLLEQGVTMLGVEKIARSIISQAPLSFVLDDNRKVSSPIGEHSNRLNANVCYVLADNTFTNFVSGMARDIGIVKVEFLSSILSGYLYLVEPKDREGLGIYVDVGLIATTVALTKDNGILAVRTAEMGGGHIAGALYSQFEMESFQLAELLKRKVALTLDVNNTDTYSVIYKSEKREFNALTAGKTVEACVVGIAETLQDMIDSFEVELPHNIPVHLTGGGISYIRGARELVNKILMRRVVIVKPRLPRLNKAELSSELGLLDFAISDDMQRNLNNTVFSRILNFLRR